MKSSPRKAYRDLVGTYNASKLGDRGVNAKDLMDDGIEIGKSI